MKKSVVCRRYRRRRFSSLAATTICMSLKWTHTTILYSKQKLPNFFRRAHEGDCAADVIFVTSGHHIIVGD